MSVSDTRYLDLEQVERNFYSTRQDNVHSQQKVVTEERSLLQFSRSYLQYEGLAGEGVGGSVRSGGGSRQRRRCVAGGEVWDRGHVSALPALDENRTKKHRARTGDARRGGEERAEMLMQVRGWAEGAPGHRAGKARARPACGEQNRQSLAAEPRAGCKQQTGKGCVPEGQ